MHCGFVFVNKTLNYKGVKLIKVQTRLRMQHRGLIKRNSVIIISSEVSSLMTFRVLFREINPDPEMNTSTKISTFTLSEGNCELLILLAPHYM